MKGIPRPGGGSQGNRSALVGCVAFSVMVGLGLSIGLAMKAGRGPPGDNGTTCSTSSEEGSAWTFDTPTQTDSCLDWVDGDSPQYPDDFSVLNFYRMYECAASNERIFMGNGIPDHDVHLGNPNSPCELNWLITMPLTPTVGESPTEPSALGIIGVATNGVPIYGAQEGGGTNAVEPGSGSSVIDAQYWYGHAAPTADWHYHNPFLGHEEQPAEDELLGYALDGYPIYGPVTDDAVLDECNGMEVNGTYQYHVRTLDQVDGAADYCDGSSPVVQWRYVLGCYTGSLDETSVGYFTNSYTPPADCTVVMESGTPNYDATRVRSEGGHDGPPMPSPMVFIIIVVAVCATGAAVSITGVWCYRKRKYLLASQTDDFLDDFDDDAFTYDPNEEVDPEELEQAEVELQERRGEVESV